MGCTMKTKKAFAIIFIMINVLLMPTVVFGQDEENPRPTENPIKLKTIQNFQL